MPSVKNIFGKIKRSHLQVGGVLLLLSLAIFLLWFGNKTSNQSSGVSAATLSFEGEYQIAGGDWQPIEMGAHIPATRGDVALRLVFHLTDPDGNSMDERVKTAPVAFYTDHIGLTFFEDGKKLRITDNENPMIGAPACGEKWTTHTVKIATEGLEIVVHNPHAYGNETAIDELLSNLSLWGGIDFEKEILKSGEAQRNAGILLLLVSVVFIGIALFSSLIHIKNSRIIWLLGLVVSFAGLYLSFSARGVSYWSESVVTNTTVLYASMMLYAFFLSAIITCLLKKTKPLGNAVLSFLAVACAALLLLPVITDVYFYDTLLWWVAVQAVANAALTACLVTEFVRVKDSVRWIYIGAILPLVAFAADAIGTHVGTWKGGALSQFVFIILFAVAMIMVLRLIPHNINAATKARELELEKTTLNAELAESRISTMMSQIRPHFIYNTLGSIEQLCKLDPPKAGDLVHNFAKYLRGNFGELDNPKPILMSQEMEHVHHYISIENVRFPDMTFSFEMKSEDFKIPALTVQPIVENAIKHGLMKLPRGGRIQVVSYETEQSYCVSVVDDGAGFDTGVLLDERRHVGLRNIRERLKVMVNGKLDIESKIGEGTRVLITIPKEVRG